MERRKTWTADLILKFHSKSWLLNLKFEPNGFEFQTIVLNLLKNKNLKFCLKDSNQRILKSKPRIIWIQMKGFKSNIFEFNSRLSKRDLNLFQGDFEILSEIKNRHRLQQISNFRKV
jgi:hypothetical protein